MAVTNQVIFFGYVIRSSATKYLDDYWVASYTIYKDGEKVRENKSASYSDTAAIAESAALLLGVQHVDLVLVPKEELAAARWKVLRR